MELEGGSTTREDNLRTGARRFLRGLHRVLAVFLIGKYGLKHPEYSRGFLRVRGRVLGDTQTMGTAVYKTYSNLTQNHRSAV